jgi:hypothetical protein
MNLSLVYAKTQTGLDEIAQRTRGLSVRLRTCLLRAPPVAQQGTCRQAPSSASSR